MSESAQAEATSHRYYRAYKPRIDEENDKAHKGERVKKAPRTLKELGWLSLAWCLDAIGYLWLLVIILTIIWVILGKRWAGILLISPLWGLVSTQLLLQSWLAAANFLIHLLGFVKGTVPRKDNALSMGVALLQVVLFSLLLRGGEWLLTGVLRFGYTRAENIVYWVFAALSAVYLLPQIPSKIKKSWRHAMIPGSLYGDILERRFASVSVKASSEIRRDH